VSLAATPTAYLRRRRLWRAAREYVHAELRRRDLADAYRRRVAGDLAAAKIADAHADACRRVFERLLDAERAALVDAIRALPVAISGGGGKLRDWVGGELGSKLLTYGPDWYAHERLFTELARRLRDLAETQPQLWRHLRDRYDPWDEGRVRVSLRRVRFRRRRGGGRGEPATLAPNEAVLAEIGPTSGALTIPCQVETWGQWVDLAEVRRALDWLIARMDCEIYSPRPSPPPATIRRGVGDARPNPGAREPIAAAGR
jgi:hypothetical protein